MSQVLLDDGLYTYESSGLSSRRLSLAYTPAGEPSLDAYDQELGHATMEPVFEDRIGAARRKMSMAEHLDERAQFDMTTPEGIVAQAQTDRAKKSAHGFAEGDVAAARPNVSMTRVTMDLQGHRTPVESEYEAATKNPSAAWHRGSYSGADAVPSTRRKSMSEYLSEQTMADAVRFNVITIAHRPLTRLRPTQLQTQVLAILY